MAEFLNGQKIVSFPNKNIHHEFREGYIEGLSWALSTKDEEL